MRFTRRFVSAFFCMCLVQVGQQWVFAAATPIEICFQDHHFVPQNLTVPAGQELTINVVNASKETIEFESFKLNRERAVSPGETIKVQLPALSPGSYDFYDDFHQDVPEGSIVAK
jgi:hypothetical protein